jgi:hypothetical protein
LCGEAVVASSPSHVQPGCPGSGLWPRRPTAASRAAFGGARRAGCGCDGEAPVGEQVRPSAALDEVRQSGLRPLLPQDGEKRRSAAHLA